MPEMTPMDCELLYQGFHSPITQVDCGTKCAPYNEGSVPFCCDTHHAVPTAYELEWAYLRSNTNLWHLWQVDDPKENVRLQSQTPPGLVLIECKGHILCERQFRTFTCRAFPFFPYINQEGKFLGLSYYWEYEDRCWVISHFEEISLEYVTEFITTIKLIFQSRPNELQAFRYHSGVMRRVFGRKHRPIPLIDSNGLFYKITPRSGRMRRVRANQMSNFGPYRLAAQLPFPDELL